MPEKHLFVDTNVFLDFYTLTKEDIEELRKLVTLVSEGTLALYVTEQVRNEFRRNRDKKLRDTINQFKEAFRILEVPSLAREYEEYEQLSEAVTSYQYYYARILDQFIEDAKQHELNADYLIEDLLRVCYFIGHTEDIYNRATKRVYLGDPPGKNYSTGDAINWLSLLQEVPDGSDLYFIGGDKDFSSGIDTNTFNSFLLREWQQEKGSHVYYYFRGLGRFFKDHYPHVIYAADFLRKNLIEELQRSQSFRQSRRVLQELKDFEHFTTEELEAFAYAILFNEHVLWIRQEAVVDDIISRMVRQYAHLLDEETLAQIRAYYSFE